MTIVEDPRVGHAENNLFGFPAAVEDPVFTIHDEADLLWYTSDVDFPIFNGVLRARFEHGQARQRANAALYTMIAHARPFLWWLTPSTRFPRARRRAREAWLGRRHTQRRDVCRPHRPAGPRGTSTGRGQHRHSHRRHCLRDDHRHARRLRDAPPSERAVPRAADGDRASKGGTPSADAARARSRRSCMRPQ
jgi:hypothetical protein